MKNTLIFIRFFFIFAIIFLILSFLSYIFSDNQFLCTVTSGIFISFFVLLLTEVRRYFFLKGCTEKQIYDYIISIYSLLALELRNASVYLNAGNVEIKESLFHFNIKELQRFYSFLGLIDYEVLNISSYLYKKIKELKEKNLPKIYQHILLLNNYEISFYKTKIRNLENGKDLIPLASDELIKKILFEIKEDAENNKVLLEELIDFMEQKNPKKFNFKKEIDYSDFNIFEKLS